MIELIKGSTNFLDCIHIARLGLKIHNVVFLIIVENCGGCVLNRNLGTNLYQLFHVEYLI